MATARKPPDVVWAEGCAEDLAAVARLAERAFETGWRERWSERQMADLLAMPGAWLDLARGMDRTILAFALSRQVGGEVELLLCAVDPGWRRQGLGLRLMQRVWANAQRRGAERLFLEVREGNRPARRLYQSFGMRQVGRRAGYYRHVSGALDDAMTLAITIPS